MNASQDLLASFIGGALFHNNTSIYTFHNCVNKKNNAKKNFLRLHFFSVFGLIYRGICAKKKLFFIADREECSNYSGTYSNGDPPLNIGVIEVEIQC